MKIISKIFIVFFIGSIISVSCSVDDGENFFQTSQVSPILDFNVPDTMVKGETYTLGITYQKDSDCHRFSNFESVNQGDSLYYVRAITIFTQAPNCNQDVVGDQKEVDFTNNFESNFTFKFLNGKDSLGDFTYLDKDVIVIEN